MSNSVIRKEVKFGTDGWRGVIADNFTFKNVSYVGQAIADWVIKNHKPNKRIVAVGYDARFLSFEFSQLMSSILAANNIKVYHANVLVPTPALSYGVVDLKGCCGVMITASHNPAKFNGIKIKTAEGGGAGEDITDKVEGLLCKSKVKSMDFDQAVKEKKVVIHDFHKAYLTFMKKYVDLKKIRESKFNIIQDNMYGSGRGVIAAALKGSKIKADFLHGEINPSFGGVKPEPIAEYIPELIKIMKSKKYDLGLVLDGDADRIAAVAPGGEFISPQKILGLLGLHLYRNKKRKGGLVKTTCGSTMMDKICDDLGLKLWETPVGFKYISHLMVTEEIIAGGEEAGGMGVQGYIPERDGNLAGLLLLEMMVYENKNIKQLVDDMEKKYGRYYYERADLELGDGKYDEKRVASVKSLLGKKVVEVKDFDGVKLICEDESWLMLRPSGTEPLVRAYSEAKSLKQAKALLDCGKKLLK
jgi:phosphomannomutase